VTWPGATTEVIGDAKDGTWLETQIRQTDDDAGADLAIQK